MVGLLKLGEFKFQPTGPSYESLQEGYEYKWTEQDLLLSAPSQYWGGKKSHNLTITGSLYIELTLPRYGNSLKSTVLSNYNSLASIRNSFSLLDAMASRGESYFLVDTTGRNYGKWVILGFNVTKTHFWNDGIPRKQDFVLNLRKDLSSDPEQVKEDKRLQTLDIVVVKVRDIFN